MESNKYILTPLIFIASLYEYSYAKQQAWQSYRLVLYINGTHKTRDNKDIKILH